MQHHTSGEPNETFSAGLAKGAAMTDDEVLRFANGVIAAINSDILTGCRSAKSARLGLEGFLDLLADKEMVATVGYAGTAVIRPISAAVGIREAA